MGCGIKRRNMLISIFYLSCFLAVTSAISVSEPISPADYQRVIAQGFATNWFKTEHPLGKYNDKNIEDIYAKGFRNLRLRSRADLYTAPYNNSQFRWFLGNLTVVVDKCLEVGVAPIISWIHHHAEAYATEQDRLNYVTWWTAVATHLKNKDYRLGFNLFTELGLDGCGGTKSSCNESLRMNADKYNRWTADAVRAIREAGGNNAKRILILASPQKTAKGLHLIDKNIYKNDRFMMAEWHTYASGPNKKRRGAKYWKGDGKRKGRSNVRKAFKKATRFTKKSKLLTYFGAWMPTDNKKGSLREYEVINFGRFFAKELRKINVPWSLNVLDRYYDTKRSRWLTAPQEIKGRSFNMSRVLDNIRDVM